MRKAKKSKNTVTRVAKRARATGKRNEAEVVVRTPLGFPDRYQTTLSYYQQIIIAPGAQIGQYTFRGNSLFDPDYTGGGHQPKYFDQLSAVYGQYRVTGSSIQLSFMSNSTNVPCTISLVPNTNIITATTPDLAAELPRAREKTVGVNGVMTGVLTHSARTAEVCGLHLAGLYDQDWAATTGSNPLQIWYWNIVAYVFTGSNVSVDINVSIRYQCEFFDRIDVGASYLKNPEQIPKEQRPYVLHSTPQKAETRGVENNTAPRNPWSREVSRDRAAARG